MCPKQKELISEIKEKTKTFLENRKNANNLIDIISILENTEEEDVILVCVRSLHKIFSLLLSQNEMYMDSLSTEEEHTKEDKYRLWLRERYTDVRSNLMKELSSDSSTVQELSLCTLMKFVEAEGQTPLRKISGKQLYFPSAFFEQVVLHLLSDQLDLKTLIARFQEFLEYDDVRYHTMKTILKQLKEKDKKGLSDIYMGNVFAFLSNLSMPITEVEDPMKNFLSKPPDTGTSLKVNTYKEHKKLFTSVWIQFLKMEMSSSLYKKVLLILHEKVMPHMTSPLLLSDFLTNSYNIGGAISLLALNGLFILVNSYNLDYPDFFKKLYALFEPTVFHVKYRARFFFLSDLFLTSTHLPAYLVAAFAKKLSRLSLTAPPNGLTVIIPMIYNLMQRHPSCKVLHHRPDGPTDLTNDPFDMDEADPAKCKALESSLWEIKTLQNHYHHSIATNAKKIDLPLPTQEMDLSDLLETTTVEMFQKEVKKKLKEMPVTFDPPKGLFGNKEDKFKDLWTLY